MTLTAADHPALLDGRTLHDETGFAWRTSMLGPLTAVLRMDGWWGARKSKKRKKKEKREKESEPSHLSFIYLDIDYFHKNQVETT